MKICCPTCHGTGNIKAPNLHGKNMDLKKSVARKLKVDGYSIREIMLIMGYKSPRSIQDLLI